MIPPILGTDNTDYLERLCPVLVRERIHPSGVVRLRDAAFCEERGIEHLSSSAEHTALLENGDRMLDAFLSGLAERFFDGKRKPRSLRFYEVAPLDAAYRAKIGDGQTVSSDMVRYGICVACCDMAPTLRNFNRLRNLQRQPVPLTGEQERIVSSLVARPDNVRFPNVEMRVRIPAKGKGQRMNI